MYFYNEPRSPRMKRFIESYAAVFVDNNAVSHKISISLIAVPIVIIPESGYEKHDIKIPHE